MQQLIWFAWNKIQCTEYRLNPAWLPFLQSSTPQCILLHSAKQHTLKKWCNDAQVINKQGTGALNIRFGIFPITWDVYVQSKPYLYSQFWSCILKWSAVSTVAGVAVIPIRGAQIKPVRCITPTKTGSSSDRKPRLSHCTRLLLQDNRQKLGGIKMSPQNLNMKLQPSKMCPYSGNKPKALYSFLHQGKSYIIHIMT